MKGSLRPEHPHLSLMVEVDQFMKRLFLVTVDCDLRTDDVRLRQSSLDTLLRIFADNGVGGHTTWFLNENDFHITKNHPSFLHEALRRGDTLGLHDHFEPFEGVYEVAPIRAFCGHSKQSVEQWLAAQGYPDHITYHRNGCLVQHADIYAALKELGYNTVSEVWPGNVRPDRAGYPAFDNREVPIGILPYRHDEVNFDDYGSTRGHFLHFPAMHMFMVNLNFDMMDRWLRAFSEASTEQAVLVWLFHPYEIMNKARTVLEPDLADMLSSYIQRLADEYQVTFVSMAECRGLLSNEE